MVIYAVYIYMYVCYIIYAIMSSFMLVNMMRVYDVLCIIIL